MTADGAPTSGTAGVIPPPVLFLGALGAGIALGYWKPLPLLAHAAVVRIVGAVLIAAGLALSAWMSIHFRRSATPVSPLTPTRRLVVSGPYRFSRNPDYIGQTLVYLGIGLALNSLWPFIVLVPTLLVLRYAVIAREERYLRRLLGAEYDDYCRRVRRWL
ncbi:MAG TPA: isoprenylcysteine carboxylmethyltransferase family protein [Gammaproteobacteria bacterium]|nr:isoprenylcysteine carboxylmethyltransferase family protein [Gammaproteobacteria bacterium]